MDGEFRTRVALQALLLCFRLHESRTAVASSTATAMLRQLIMFVVDKVLEEDRRLLLAGSNQPPFQTERRDLSAPQRVTRSPPSRTYAC